MGFELPDGKTARNLQDQVKFLSEKLKDLYAAFNESGLKKIEIVEELPEVGDPTVLYLLAREDPDEGNYYDEYLWYDNQWEQIGSTQIDLSDYCTLSTDQTLPGTKLLRSIKISEPGYDASSWTLKGWGASGLDVRLFSSERGVKISESVVRSLRNSETDLGSSSYKWKDIYLSGKVIIGTSDFYQPDSVQLSLEINNARQYDFTTTYVRPRNDQDLGTSSYKWKDLYLSGKVINDTNAFELKNSNNEFDFTISSVSKLRIASNLIWAGAGILPTSVGAFNLGNAAYKWNNIYLSGIISDGNNGSYGLKVPNTTGWSANKTISVNIIKKHSVSCSNGTLEVYTNYLSSITEGSSCSAACSSAVLIRWQGYPAIYCSGTVVHYYDYSDLTIKSASIGTITSDTIEDY